MAAAHPERAALKIPRGRSRDGIDYLALSFAELDAEVAGWCARLRDAGIGRGDRTLIMVRQGLPLIASVFALFRIGAVPVVIDPGMGLRSFLACVSRSRPRAVVGIPSALIVSRLFRSAFRSVGCRVMAASALTARVRQPERARAEAGRGEAQAAATDLAAVLFTSGSTGAAKGVRYEHGMFDAQVELIRTTYGIEPGEIDLPMLPVFALFNPALGMTTIVPEIDPSHPAQVNPARIVQAIRQEGVTNSFGSPTLWQKIGDHCLRHGIALPTLRRVLCAGAAVPSGLWRDSREFLGHGRLHSPYGATEALPVASIDSDGIALDSVQGACVGRPVRGIDVRIIPVADGPLGAAAAARPLPVGEIGEIIVRGPVVTQSYDALPEADAAAKIPAEVGAAERSGAAWHRMGDCGYLDAEGRLWFCGRKAERVESGAGVLHTEPCEQVFRRHPRAARCALVGIGNRPEQRPALVVETSVRNSSEARALARELRALALEHPHTLPIKLFYFRSRLPVDVRHNAKIHRLALARWAARARGFESDPKR